MVLILMMNTLKVIKELENKLVLVYIGEHFSGDSNKSMIDNLKKRKNVKNLLAIKKIRKN